jgi:hypothetical protein
MFYKKTAKELKAIDIKLQNSIPINRKSGDVFMTQNFKPFGEQD